MQPIKFGVFSDFHYKKGMYNTVPSDLATIFKRMTDEKVDFVLHGGDFCNDYIRSPELLQRYIDNPQGLKVYGIYGNHELETEGNTMAFVTPMLTNDLSVKWGTKDGTVGDGSTAYYTFDCDEYRFVMLDTNYSLRPDGKWEHNHDGHFTWIRGNSFGASLGNEQLVWLENTLMTAAKEKKHCILMSHAAFHPSFDLVSPDAEAVRGLIDVANKEQKGTVIMVMNGHIHTNHLFEENGVVWFDINSAKNSWWQEPCEEHYGDGHTYSYENYDNKGNLLETYDRKLNTLDMARNTWFSAEPLSAVVSIDENGTVTVKGSKSHWVYDIQPAHRTFETAWPEISSKTFEHILG